MRIIRDFNDFEFYLYTIRQPLFAVDHLCHFSDCTTVNNRNRVHSDKRFEGMLKNGAVDIITIWIWPVKNKQRYIALCTCLHHIMQGTDVGIKPASDILYVKNYNIDARKLFLAGFPIFSIDGDNRNAGSTIFRIINQFSGSGFTPETMFGCKYSFNC